MHVCYFTQKLQQKHQNMGAIWRYQYRHLLGESSKKCQGPFGPLLSYFWGSTQSLKSPDFLFSLMGLITVSNFEGPAGPHSVNFEGPQSILKAIGPRARPILTPVSPSKCFASRCFAHKFHEDILWNIIVNPSPSKTVATTPKRAVCCQSGKKQAAKG